ncbi:MAG TPA: aldo/keto reductase [Actinomycetota bacterium]|nr:aldo/keto reductase [Actinomycetota bacterium]
MRHRRLGSRGPELSVIGYGAWEAGGADWGANESDKAVVASMRAALDAGIDWIDTAEVYGKGVSEKLVGKAVAGRRDEVLIATKVAPGDEGSGFAPDRIRAACDASLERLGIDHIDVYQLHWPDPLGTPIEETWGAMAELQDEGKVRAIGVSNFDRELIERCEPIRHVDSLQQEFSMLVLDDRELIRWCGERGTGVLSYSPLGAGLLTGAIGPGWTPPPGDWRAEQTAGPFADLDTTLAILELLRPQADRFGLTTAQLALAWNLAQPGVTAAIAGSRHPAHVRENAAAGDVELDPATLAELEASLPTSA